MNAQSRGVSRGGLSSTLTATTGAYSPVAASDMSQTKEEAPAAEACLLSRFQVAWATAATRIRARAVALTGAAPGPGPGSRLTGAPGVGNGGPWRFLSGQVGPPRRLAPLGPAASS